MEPKPTSALPATTVALLLLSGGLLTLPAFGLAMHHKRTSRTAVGCSSDAYNTFANPFLRHRRHRP
ncbi:MULTISPECIES: hypothetical protein [Hymenobacter]|uniref:hypothetical protein n=1 Tax=Hymenobacter TaxID=89966 RepID=UPI000AF89531|nr:MULTISPECIES: hypothetical protein [Hymenobacter]